MFELIKKGFGVSVGAILGIVTLYVISECFCKHYANNEKFMERLKTRNQKLYEDLKKYK